MNLPKEQYERLKELARKQNRSVQQLIILAINKYLDGLFSDEHPYLKPSTIVEELKEKTNGKPARFYEDEVLKVTTMNIELPKVIHVRINNCHYKGVIEWQI